MLSLWVNDATIGVLLKCFVPRSDGHVQTVWLTIFCALVLYDCVCDMDHKSVITTIIIYYY